MTANNFPFVIDNDLKYELKNTRAATFKCLVVFSLKKRRERQGNTLSPYIDA